VRKTPKREISARVTEVARLLRLDELLDRRPAALSGGQRQRVAMGRAIVREPKAFLMDEPLSNLDAKLRVSMRSELVSLHARLGATTVYVTHDQVEAMTLGQRVAVMRDGKIQQVDSPQALYRFPENLYVAAFIGSPAMNLVEAEVADGRIAFGGYRLPVPESLRDSLADGRVVLGARPEAFEDAAFADPSLPQIDVDVTVLEELGSDTHVIFPVDAPRVETEELRGATAGPEASLLAEDRAVFNARVDPRTTASSGRPLRIAVDPSRFYFFDPATGENVGRRLPREHERSSLERAAGAPRA
jgi:multiple sugar transport system ATP-binding protein